NHVKVAFDLKRKGVKIRGRTIISYIITKNGKTISEKARWFEDADNYDPDYYINNQVVPAAVRILSVFGYNKEDLIGEQSSLMGF
ncbi:MAG: DNA polymerase, partial [Candidatus Aenigmarchaeota archaeon]|nr:DNA polymerase [Candidatus Aenigmarchaeota archaeon]